MTIDELVTKVIAGTAVIVALSHLLRSLAQRLGQPAVIGQIFAGIALGPSLLGHFPGNPTEVLFPAKVLPYLSVVAQVALVPFLFAVACELDLRVLRTRRRVVPMVTACAFVIPMMLGAGGAFLIGPIYTPPGGDALGNTGFVLFMAVSMAVTAVPVLASIIRDRGATGSVTGVVAMTSAGFMDAIGWLVLAAAVLIGGNAAGDHLPLPTTVVLFAVYALVMAYAVRPVLRTWLSRPAANAAADLPVVASLAMASAWATAALGLHVIFGAFVAGLIMPRGADGAPDADLVRPLEESGSLMLPVFFVVSGLSVDFGAMTASHWALLGIFTGLAVLGKLGGGILGARLGGMGFRDATVVGVMLNTRGLTELIALNIGLQSGIIDEALYTVLVLVALVTTAATGPALNLLGFPRADEVRAVPSPAGSAADDPAAAPAAEAGSGPGSAPAPAKDRPLAPGTLAAQSDGPATPAP